MRDFRHMTEPMTEPLTEASARRLTDSLARMESAQNRSATVSIACLTVFVIGFIGLTMFVSSIRAEFSKLDDRVRWEERHRDRGGVYAISGQTAEELKKSEKLQALPR